MGYVKRKSEGMKYVMQRVGGGGVPKCQGGVWGRFWGASGRFPIEMPEINNAVETAGE